MRGGCFGANDHLTICCPCELQGHAVSHVLTSDTTATTVDSPIQLTIEAHDSFGNVDPINETVILQANGSASGLGNVMIVNGIATSHVDVAITQHLLFSLGVTNTDVNQNSSVAVFFDHGMS